MNYSPTMSFQRVVVIVAVVIVVLLDESIRHLFQTLLQVARWVLIVALFLVAVLAAAAVAAAEIVADAKVGPLQNWEVVWCNLLERDALQDLDVTCSTCHLALQWLYFPCFVGA